MFHFQHAYALELLKDQLKEGMTALDVGSGSGYLTVCFALMVSIFYKVNLVWIDISETVANLLVSSALLSGLHEPGLGVGIDPGMALTPFPSSIGLNSNPRPSNCESSLITTRPDFRPLSFFRLANVARLLESITLTSLSNGQLKMSGKIIRTFSILAELSLSVSPINPLSSRVIPFENLTRILGVMSIMY